LRGSNAAGGAALGAGAAAGVGTAGVLATGGGAGALGAGGRLLPHASAAKAIGKVFSEFFAEQSEGGQDKGRVLL